MDHDSEEAECVRLPAHATSISGATVSRAHSLLQIVRNFREIRRGRLGAFDDIGGDDVGPGAVGAFFEGFLFEPDLNSLGAKNETWPRG